MKRMSSFNYAAAALFVAVLVLAGCAHAPQNIVKPSPNFAWNPPSKLRAKKINLALISPNFSSNSNFGSYQSNAYLSTYLSSFQTDLQTILIAKGFTVSGPFEDYEMMTYPDKKAANLALIPELVFSVLESYPSHYQSEDGMLIQQRGTIRLNGYIRFSMVEPITKQKMWIKKINLPELQEPVLVDLFYSHTGGLNPFHENQDNREAALVNILNKIYPEVMEKFWKYLNNEEIRVMAREARKLRKRKRY